MDRLLTVDQAGELLNTGPRFVRRLIAERRIELSTWVGMCESAKVHYSGLSRLALYQSCRFLRLAVHENGSATLRQPAAAAFRAISGALYRPRRSTADRSSDFSQPDAGASVAVTY